MPRSGWARLDGARGEKTYAHYFDDAVGGCLVPSNLSRAERDRADSAARARWYSRELWLRARLRNEMLVHVLHAMGIVTWVQ